MKSRYHGNVLVLGHGDRAFLTVIRSLGRAGLNVHVAMCRPGDRALKSRYVTKWYDVPTYQPGDDSWINAIEAVLDQTSFQLVVPCEDQAVIPLQDYQERLGRRCQLYVLGERAYETTFSKIKSAELATKLRIAQPKTVVLDTSDNWESIADFSLPVVVKPPSSFTSDDLSAKRGVVRCRTRSELTEKLTALGTWGGAVVQENFTGTGVGVELLVHDGEVLVAFQHVRVHEPLEGGGSSYRRSAPLHPELLAASKSMMKELGYTGVAMVEFKVNFETGRWVFIEINGRFWGSLPLAVAAGVDFPLYLYELLVHDRRDFPQCYRVPLFCRNISSDQRWLRTNLRADKSNPLLATRPLRSVALEPLNTLLLRERWDTLVWDDPAPGVADLAGIVGDAVGKAVRVCRRRLDDSYPIKRWRRRRALAKAQAAKNILFVCKGNICRSPYAEHYARRQLPRSITVTSCGYYPITGRVPPEVAQDIAAQFGVDLRGHRSQVISEELIHNADLIFTFDEQNRDTVLRRFPSCSGRVFGIGVLCSRYPYQVADPYGSEGSAFEAVYAQIAEAIDHLSANLRDETQVHATVSHELGRDNA